MNELTSLPTVYKIDHKYICGRDNYTCFNCRKELSSTMLNERLDRVRQALGADRVVTFTGETWDSMDLIFFKKIDEEGEDLPHNYVISCRACLNFEVKNLPSKTFSGRLIVVTGPMYSSKTTTTEAIYNKNKVFNKAALWVKPNIDDRETGFTKTHNEKRISAYTIDAKRPDLSLDVLIKHRIIAFDEVQFFNERLLYVIYKLLDNGAIVIVDGLKLTASRDHFGIMHYLLADADDILFLKAVCNVCKTVDSATRTKCFNTNLPSVSTGGMGKYYAVCPVCDGSQHEIEFLEKSFQKEGV